MELLRPTATIATKGNELSNKKCIEIDAGSRLYSLLTKYIASNAENSQSFRADVSASSNTQESGCDSCCQDSDMQQVSVLSKTVGRIALECGLGQFTFPDHKGNKLIALHQQIGIPVGTDCGVKIYTNLIIYTDNEIEDLANFLTYLVEVSEKSEEGVFVCFKWHVRYHYWKKGNSCKARPVSSVILPKKTKNTLLNDISTFLSAKTKHFYEQHGIPYRRSYLFYGVPGSGKSSLIQALAGHFKRSISFVQPSDPDMTDDSLSDAISQLPKDTIVVFEDIDSLFDISRSSKVMKSNLTFSGLLNALDGVGSSNGQIFILTTNLREQLDSALIRKGRVDLQIGFTYADQEQIEEMWTSFYPSADIKFTTEFSSQLLNLLKENSNNITAAGLQHFFVMNMYKSPEEAIQNIGSIIEDMKDINGDKTIEEKKSKDDEKKNKKDTKKKAAKKKANTKNPSGQGLHIHLHTATATDDNNASDDDSESGDEKE